MPIVTDATLDAALTRLVSDLLRRAVNPPPWFDPTRRAAVAAQAVYLRDKICRVRHKRLQHDWEPEQQVALAELWASGKSVRTIARELTERFTPTNFTVGMIVGAVRRRKLLNRPSPLHARKRS